MGDGATRRPWPLRAADLDMVGHVNNAAVWEALSEVVTAPLAQVSVTHHGALEREDDVELVSAPGVADRCTDCRQPDQQRAKPSRPKPCINLTSANAGQNQGLFMP